MEAVLKPLSWASLEDRGLVEIVPGKMLVDIAEHRVALQKRRHRLVDAGDLEARVDRVGEVPGIAEHVAGRHDRSIRHGEGWKQRMAVAQTDALARERGHGGGGNVIDRTKAQAVGDEQHHIVRPRWRRLPQCGRRRACQDRT